MLQYVGVLGNVNNDGDEMAPQDVFLDLFGEDIIEHITFHTNLYATQKEKPFKPVTKDDLKVFLGINILMGIKRPRSYHSCWSTHEELRDPFISSLMTLNRFSWIHIHLNDNTLMPRKGQPKLYKIRPLVGYLKKTFKENSTPTKDEAIDGCMVMFRGSIRYKQYMPKMPVKEDVRYGIVTYSGCSIHDGTLLHSKKSIHYS
jgi:hypothetical protein